MISMRQQLVWFFSELGAVAQNMRNVIASLASMLYQTLQLLS